MVSRTNKMPKMQMHLPFYRKKNNDPGSVELSTNKLTPGILKIFGDHVSPGSNYKAVRVSTLSTAEEVVREALEKFNLERSNPKDFVLCDVIGQFVTPGTPTTPGSETSGSETTAGGDKPKKKNLGFRKSVNRETVEEEQPEWVTEYVRAINEIEKPLVLQSLWKPTNGRSRRFELRNRIELENSFFFFNNSTTNDMCPSETVDSVNGSTNSIHADVDSAMTHNLRPSASHHVTTSAPRSCRKDETSTAPTTEPYLLMLKGCGKTDKLLHRLTEQTITVGPYADGERRQCDILLYSSDILHPHCWIYKRIVSDETTDTSKEEVYIEPANGADVTINGVFITSKTLLHPGQLLTMGHDYVFLFKDQTAMKDSRVQLPWLEFLKNDCAGAENVDEPEYAVISRRKDTRDKCIQVELHRGGTGVSGEGVGKETDLSIGSDIDQGGRNSRGAHGNKESGKADFKKSTLQLSYKMADEEQLLHKIIEICDSEGVGSFKLLPAYLFIMTIEHSAATFKDIETRKLLLKISSGLQGIAWEKTKEIGKAGSANESDPIALHEELLPKLKPILFWLTNALQMLHYLQCHLKNYLVPREYVQSSQHAVLTADEELLSVLEEVIMFTFQQLVYHLTKILYGALPAVLEVNPFQGKDSEGEDDERQPHPSIINITTIFTDVLDASTEHEIHPQIISQIFSYLFFFCNALLFNSLMEKGPTSKIFRWKKGVQIQGNLQAIEEWAVLNNLGTAFDEYLGKFKSIVSLLSTPRATLMHSTWDQLRFEYPLLNPAQLQLVLSEYQLPADKPKPRGWSPPANVPEEVESSRRSSEVLESFATHPPLMLPSSNFVLDLDVSPDNVDFHRHLRSLTEKFDRSEVDEDIILPKARTHPTTNIPRLEIYDSHPDYEDFESVAGEEGNFASARVEGMEDTRRAQVRYHDNDLTPSLVSGECSPRTSYDVIAGSVTTQNNDVNIPSDQTPENIHVTEAVVHQAQEYDRLPRSPSPVNVGLQISPPPKDIGASNEDVNGNFSMKRNDLQADEEFVDIKKEGEVYSVELTRVNNVLGLGLIDGQFTPMKDNGVYIRTIVPNTPASSESRLRIGDRILSVNEENVYDKDYTYAMGLIKTCGESIRLAVCVSSEEIVKQILAIA